jgi:hypothetical protein
MDLKIKTLLMVSSLITVLFSARAIHSDLIRISDHTAEEISSALATGQHSLSLVSFSPLIVNGNTLGEVFVYDDPTTERSLDYLVLYDSAGDLVAFSWFDRFGIQRTAVDRGVLDKRGKPDGVFVFFLDGDSI